MKRLLIRGIVVVAGAVISRPELTSAQLLLAAKPAEHVAIIQGPMLELAVDNFAILRWTSTNPGRDDDHFAIAHYGTAPGDLSQTAKSHIRLNPNHPETIFRVRLSGLKPRTTYYYWVTSMAGDGRNDGVKSGINQFTTPAPGQRIINYPQPK